MGLPGEYLWRGITRRTAGGIRPGTNASDVTADVRITLEWKRGKQRKMVMGSQIEPNGDFIEQWLNARMAEAKLDQRILTLVDTHRKASVLDEANLLASLIALAEALEDENGSYQTDHD